MFSWSTPRVELLTSLPGWRWPPASALEPDLCPVGSTAWPGCAAQRDIAALKSLSPGKCALSKYFVQVA